MQHNQRKLPFVTFVRLRLQHVWQLNDVFTVTINDVNVDNYISSSNDNNNDALWINNFAQTQRFMQMKCKSKAHQNLSIKCICMLSEHNFSLSLFGSSNRGSSILSRAHIICIFICTSRVRVRHSCCCSSVCDDVK